MGRYRITWVETITSWGHVEVEAESPEAAEARAEEEYDPAVFEDSAIEVNYFNTVPIAVESARAEPPEARRDMDGRNEGEAGAVAGRRLTIAEIEDLSPEEFDALPEGEKQRYFRYMTWQNSPPQDEL